MTLAGSGQNVSVGELTWGQGVWVQAEAVGGRTGLLTNSLLSFIYFFTTDGIYTP